MNEDNGARLVPHIKAKVDKAVSEMEPVIYDYPMLPPWEAMPDIAYGSIGWRMGGGDQYLNDFGDWLEALEPGELSRYLNENLEPQSWAGFYEVLFSRRKT